MLPRLIIRDCGDIQTIVRVLCAVDENNKEARELLEYITTYATDIHSDCDHVSLDIVDGTLDWVQDYTRKERNGANKI